MLHFYCTENILSGGNINATRTINSKRTSEWFTDDNTFEYKNIDVFEAGQGEILVKTLYLSVDPYMRGRMSDAPSYSAPFEVGKALYGSTVSEVVQSNSNEFSKGDLVTGTTNFQEYNVVKPSEVRKVQTDHLKPSNALSVLGMPALTAYFGMMHIGEPKKGETVVVSGAAGAVGQVAGQLAKSVGARVVGIVGSEKKSPIYH